jgi:hypothetical protein
MLQGLLSSGATKTTKTSTHLHCPGAPNPLGASLSGSRIYTTMDKIWHVQTHQIGFLAWLVSRSVPVLSPLPLFPGCTCQTTRIFSPKHMADYTANILPRFSHIRQNPARGYLPYVIVPTRSPPGEHTWKLAIHFVSVLYIQASLTFTSTRFIFFRNVWSILSLGNVKREN